MPEVLNHIPKVFQMLFSINFSEYEVHAGKTESIQSLFLWSLTHVSREAQIEANV